MKLIQKKQTFTNPNGESVSFYQTYLLINGTLIAIKPVYKRDKYLINALAERDE